MTETDAVQDVLLPLLLGSAAVFAVLATVLAMRTRRPPLIVLTVAALAIGLGVVYAVSPRGFSNRGNDEADITTLILSYLSMVLGMIAHYVYVQAENGEKRLTFEWLPFVMPIVASPIVFIPLLSIAAGITGGGSGFTQAKVMVYLVAFQNGFFWKHFFDQRKRQATPS